MARHMLQLACFRFLLKAATAALLFPLRLCAVVKLELPSFFLRLRWDLVITWWVKIRGLAYFGPVQITTRKHHKHKKTSHRIFGHMHGVLNEVYLQNFLYRWAVNRETNLMSLLNP